MGSKAAEGTVGECSVPVELRPGLARIEPSSDGDLPMTLPGVVEPRRSMPLMPPGERIELEDGEAGMGRPRESSYLISFDLHTLQE